MWAGEASGGTDKGRQAVYSLRYSRQERRAAGSGVQKRNNRLESGRETGPFSPVGRNWGEKTVEMTRKTSSLQNMLNNSSSQVAGGHPEEEQSPR